MNTLEFLDKLFSVADEVIIPLIGLWAVAQLRYIVAWLREGEATETEACKK